MVCWPALEFSLIAILKADLAVGHMRRRIISGVSISHPALRASIMPKRNFGLFGYDFHQMDPLGWAAHGPNGEC
jgi:hypothetical protein